MDKYLRELSMDYNVANDTRLPLQIEARAVITSPSEGKLAITLTGAIDIKTFQDFDEFERRLNQLLRMAVNSMRYDEDLKGTI